VIERHLLPDDAAEWANVSIEFPRFAVDSPRSCPRTEDEIFEYVTYESGDGDSADRTRLRFLRTAHVEEQKFWLWEYVESDGVLSYILVQACANGRNLLGLTEANGLNAEQYILAAYYDEIYWD